MRFGAVGMRVWRERFGDHTSSVGTCLGQEIRSGSIAVCGNQCHLLMPVSAEKSYLFDDAQSRGGWGGREGGVRQGENSDCGVVRGLVFSLFISFIGVGEGGLFRLFSSYFLSIYLRCCCYRFECDLFESCN